jgi:hypothetical protein
VTLVATWPDTGAADEVELSYDELACLIGESVLRVYQDPAPADGGRSQLIAGILRLGDGETGAS